MYKTYDKMKDSGVEWIGKIPVEWTRNKVSRIFSVIGSGTTPKFDDAKDNSGPINWIQSGDVYTGKISTVKNKIAEEFLNEYSALKLYHPPFVVIAMYGASVGNMAISNVAGCVNQACCVLGNPTGDFNFLYYALQGTKDRLLATVVGGGQPNISQQIIKSQWLPTPPIPEQTAIAKYLDEKCAAIDGIIAEAKATIKEYKAWKASVIFEAVTKGLDPNAEMKDSGVEWIGKIPKGWDYKPLKILASYNDEVLSETTPSDFFFDYIDIGSVHTGNGIGTCERIQFKDAPSRARRVVRSGDVIVSTVRTYLKAIAQVKDYDVPHIASTGFAVIRARKINPAFLKYALLSDNFVSLVEANSVGISYPAINASQIVAFKIPVPPLPEQEVIAAYLDEKCVAIDGIIAEKESLIAELETYKKSLIFETVTGKRRVC